jgi:CheY-like chemotaxis protein
VDGGLSRPGVPEGEYVMLAVRDAGCGMDRAILDHLFEPFFTTKDKGKGTGLGLATVYGIVKQSNGFITCQSETDRGTIFKIYLPRCCEQYGEENTRRPEGEGPEPLHGTETILLVEDDQCVRELINSILVKAGYAVFPARTGAEALAAVADTRRRVDLLITDVIMPGMDGRRVAEEVMKRRPGARVLYVSGYTESSVVQRRVLCGRQNFLQKPFAAADLLRKVRETLDSGA